MQAINSNGVKNVKSISYANDFVRLFPDSEVDIDDLLRAYP
jgi:hypothetical protein